MNATIQSTQYAGETIVYANLGGKRDTKFTFVGRPEISYINDVVAEAKKIQAEAVCCKKHRRADKEELLEATSDDYTDEAAGDDEFEDLTTRGDYND